MVGQDGDRPLVWLHGEIRTPPMSAAARIEAGWLLRRLQAGEVVGFPHGRPMPSVAPRCYELRIRDENRTWRILCRVDEDAVIILEVFAKTTRTTPDSVMAVCRRRLAAYDAIARHGDP
jgi:phage-related protein